MPRATTKAPSLADGPTLARTREDWILDRGASCAMLFSGMQYRQTSSGSWLLVDVTAGSPPSPYGIADPGPGKLQVWTNAH